MMTDITNRDSWYSIRYDHWYRPPTRRHEYMYP